MELEWHIFALIFLLAAGFTLKHDKHVRVDLFYEKMNKKDKAWINVLGILLFLIPWCVLIIKTSFHYAYSSFEMGETSPDPGGATCKIYHQIFHCIRDHLTIATSNCTPN